VPVVTSRIEYRLNVRVLERRPQTDKKPKEFETVFQTDELSYVVPMRHGFKFYRLLNESNPFLRFWKVHVSDAHSGEVHVEKADQERVFELMAQHGIPSR